MKLTPNKLLIVVGIIGVGGTILSMFGSDKYIRGVGFMFMMFSLFFFGIVIGLTISNTKDDDEE